MRRFGITGPLRVFARPGPMSWRQRSRFGLMKTGRNPLQFRDTSGQYCSAPQLRSVLQRSCMPSDPIRSSRPWQDVAQEIIQTTNPPRLAELREELKGAIKDQLPNQL